MKVYKALL